MTAGIPDREADLRAYLLGTLSPEREEEIDERILADEDVHAEIQATSDDLIHAYLAGQLSAEDREHFETHFLASPRRRERVAFVRSLVTAVDRVRRAERMAPLRSRALRVLPWAAVLVMAVGLGGWSVRERRRGEQERAAAQQREDGLRRQLLEHEARVRELEGRGAASDEPQIATWTLNSGVERAPGAADGFTVRGDWIRLRVALEHDLRVNAYRALLQTADGREILRLDGLREATRGGPRTVDLIVPAGLLRPGSYLVSIQRDAPGRTDELTVTTFVVR